MTPCRCGGKPLVQHTNKKMWRVLCPHCQKYFTRDKTTREEAVTAWNENIASVGKKKKKETC